ncbi:MAG: hypothetical protein V5A81_05545 [Candidatus Bipolaricaulota bacterium]|nr:hypothetical protein [Candidatus Bipolaricaulota bacterium]MBS3792330.1 hypothetical protein [Candidatus Bipolaricaulota bacterium]
MFSKILSEAEISSHVLDAKKGEWWIRRFCGNYPVCVSPVAHYSHVSRLSRLIGTLSLGPKSGERSSQTPSDLFTLKRCISSNNLLSLHQLNGW